MYRTLVLLMLTLTAGCATTFDDPGPDALSTAHRTEMGRLAIREPMRPSVALTGEDVLETKGEAAKSKAAGAAVGWLGGSLQAGAESGDPLGFLLMATIGIVGAPVAAVGGAVYGAAAADSAEQLETGNQVIATALGFAPQHFRSALGDAFAGAVPVSYEFVEASITDTALRAQGFDAVLDVRMESITSAASESGLEVSFLQQPIGWNSCRLMTAKRSRPVFLKRRHQRATCRIGRRIPHSRCSMGLGLDSTRWRLRLPRCFLSRRPSACRAWNPFRHQSIASAGSTRCSRCSCGVRWMVIVGLDRKTALSTRLWFLSKVKRPGRVNERLPLDM